MDGFQSGRLTGSRRSSLGGLLPNNNEFRAPSQTSVKKQAVKRHHHKHNLKHRYEFLETLGKGTYGKVKKARERSGRLVSRTPPDNCTLAGSCPQHTGAASNVSSVTCCVDKGAIFRSAAAWAQVTCSTFKFNFRGKFSGGFGRGPGVPSTTEQTLPKAERVSSKQGSLNQFVFV